MAGEQKPIIKLGKNIYIGKLISEGMAQCVNPDKTPSHGSQCMKRFVRITFVPICFSVCILIKLDIVCMYILHFTCNFLHNVGIKEETCHLEQLFIENKFNPEDPLKPPK